MYKINKDRKINIGITVHIADPNDSVFTNGIRQNVITLRNLFAKCKNVKNSYIINASKNSIFKDGQENSWSPYKNNIITMQESFDKCDLIVIGQASFSKETCQILKNKGIKIVKQIMGTELSVFNESILFKPNEEARLLYEKSKGTIDSVWISPHFFESDRYFFEARYDAPTKIGPYVWDPIFIEHHMKLYKNMNNTKSCIYSPSNNKEKRISTVEPNLNMVKTSVVPIIISEIFFRKHPDLLKKSSIFCSSNISKKKDLIDFVKKLDVYESKKMFFEGRYPIVSTLLNHTDIMLCHQNQCELNYAYLDTAWMGFPIVHNSSMMKELGWYYEGNDAKKAIEHLAYIAEYFDDNEHQNEEYLKKSRAFAYRYMIDNPENVRGYERLIELAMDSKI